MAALVDAPRTLRMDIDTNVCRLDSVCWPQALPTPVSPTASHALPLVPPAPPPLRAPRPTPSSSALRIDTCLPPVAHRLPPTPSTTPQHRSPASARTPYPHYTPKHLAGRALPSPSPARAFGGLASALAPPRPPADPYADVTRLRVRPQRHSCLYPGATFVGTQHSEKSSYDVAVTIVAADLAASHLCGYLRIRGLTAEHPELTTYFDAQLIGPRHAFRSPPAFGASAREDAAHWARFPAYRAGAPRSEVDEGGVVFMRWKEKFLVPDHRVRDISGASFAGFYYVCVELDPPARRGARPARHRPARTASAPLPRAASAAAAKPPTGAPPRARGWLDDGAAPCTDEPMALSDDPAPFVDAADDNDGAAGGGAVMTGFYFHPCTEPFQQLSLRHVPGSGAAGWEFR